MSYTPDTWQIAFGALPYGYYWTRDGNGNVLGTLHVSAIEQGGTSLNAYYNVAVTGVPGNTTTGSLSHSETWGGQHILTGNVSVPSGISLKILPGTVVKFPSNSSLTANGIFLAEGNYLSHITFTSISGNTPGSWGLIILSGSGANGSTISYANIQYGTEIDVINTSNITFQNCSILNSSSTALNFSGSTGLVASNTINNSNIYHGIVINNSSTVNCYDNTIFKSNHNKQGVGIDYSGGGSGNAGQNDVAWYNWGACAIWGSSPHFYNVNLDHRNNRIMNCAYGVVIYNDSHPIIGDYDYGYGYYYGNSIYNNTVDVALNTYYSTVNNVEAMSVYWNGGNANNAVIQTGSGSHVYLDLPISQNPWASYTLLKRSGDSIETSTNKSSELNEQTPPGAEGTISEGVYLLFQNRKREAKDFFIAYLQKNPSNQEAYAELYNCYSDETADEIIHYFENLSAPTEGQKLWLSYLYLKQNKIEKAKQINNVLLAENKNSGVVLRANLNNFYIALYTEQNFDAAAEILQKVLRTSTEPNSMELLSAKNDFKTFVKAMGKYDDYKLQFGSEEEIPTSVSLLQNYPNPFNPVTTIAYSVPQDAFVTLKVYDILGREIATLVNGYYTTGNYTAQFDANKLSSGMYIYKLTTGNNSIVKKMLLMK